MKIYVHYMNLMKKPNYKKNSKSLTFEGKGCKERNLKKKPFDKKIVFNGFKMSSLRCVSHVKEKILPKNIFGCPLKFIFGNFCVFSYKPKYSYIIMYECELS